MQVRFMKWSEAYNQRGCAVAGDELRRSRSKPAINKLPADTVLDARVGLESEAGWPIRLWVRNMTDRSTTIAFSGVVKDGVGEQPVG